MVLPRSILFILIFALFFSAAPPLRASGSTGEGDAGGLVLARAGDIGIVREDLGTSS